MSKLRILKNIVIVLMFGVEPILFTLHILNSVPLFLLKQFWPIQAAIGFCLALLGMTKSQALKATIFAVVFVGETFLFTISDRMLSLITIRLLLSFPIQVFIGFYLVFIAPKISTWSIPKRIITIVIALVYCVWISIFAISFFWRVEQIRNSIDLNGNRYYLTTKPGASGPGCDFYCNFTVPALYKCDSIGLKCILVFENDFIDVSETGLVIDKKANELQVFLSFGAQGSGFYEYGLFYVYGEQSRFVQETKKFGASIYYLMTPQNDYSTYMLYECQLDSTGCKRLPFEYVTTYYLAMNIDSKGELSIIDERYNNTTPADLLVYTYNINQMQPDCKTETCTLKDK